MSTIEEVKQKTDIVEIVGQYVTLKKSGRNFSAPCPFHNETHPSFFVYPEQQSWHCFGACNTGGDVISFVMKKENMDFGDALRLLAERAGISLPSFTRDAGEKDEKERYYQINEAAAVWFHNNLLNSPAAQKARDYVKKRGYTSQTVADFQLGYGLDEWEALKHYLKEKGYEEKELVSAGLLYQNEDGRTTDRFRGKLMIPIRERRGKVTGFGARVLDDSLPKYVNSPQTPTFDKSSTLFAIDKASPEIRKLDRAVIMEGYMDVITAHQNGVRNTVASMGTAITETQVTILKKLSHNLVLAMDADAAGQEAMLRTVGHENTLDAEIRVVALPEGKDPDDVIRENVNDWNELLRKAVPLLDFLIDKTTAGLDLTTAGDKSRAAKQLVPVLRNMKDRVRQSHYLQHLARLLDVPVASLVVDMGPQTITSRRKTGAPVKPPAAAMKPMGNVLEEYFLALLLHNASLRKNADIPPEAYFTSSSNREILRTIRLIDDPFPSTMAVLKDTLEPALHEYVDTIAARELPSTRAGTEEKYNDCVLRLKAQYYKTLFARKAAAGVTDNDPTVPEEYISYKDQLFEAEKNRKRSSSRR